MPLKVDTVRLQVAVLAVWTCRPTTRLSNVPQGQIELPGVRAKVSGQLDDLRCFGSPDLLAVDRAAEYTTEVAIRLYVAGVALELGAVTQRTHDHPGYLIARS